MLKTIHACILLLSMGAASSSATEAAVDTSLLLKEVQIVQSYSEQQKQTNSLSTEHINRDYLFQNQQGNLMKTLGQLPGVSNIDIGSGMSKPVIRGLSFNRVLVVENNIKHEAQQWGVDHGLEMDAYTVDKAVVIKGPASLPYGSDAIGGVVQLTSGLMPQANTLGGSIEFHGKTNNDLLGTSLWLYGRSERIWASLRLSRIDRGDDKVPADSVDIYSYRAALYKNHLRNTAGKERNAHLTLGWLQDHYQGRLTLSRTHSKAGFFANAHGLEPRNVDSRLHDRSSRDILDPFQEVTHLKLLQTNQWSGARFALETNLGYQRNLRNEWSPYVSHGYMPATFPDSLDFDPDLERAFDKSIYTAQLKTSYKMDDNRQIVAGINGEKQFNHINGRGFMIPEFQQNSLGIYALAHRRWNTDLHAEVGLRYDLGHLQTQAYQDWFPSPTTDDTNPSEWVYLQRAASIDRYFGAWSGSVGLSYVPQPWSVKVHLGKSFRMPIAKELAANGVNYHRFSYEVGDPNLSPETSYQWDATIAYANNRFRIDWNPFFQYFPNYIYLNPTSEHDRLYGNGNQVYYYTQAKVRRYGSEIQLRFQATNHFEMGLTGEILRSKQLSGSKKGYTLPFSPPDALHLSTKWHRSKLGPIQQAYAAIDVEIVATQNRLVPPEITTPGHQIVHLSMGGIVPLSSQNIHIALQVRNLFNTKYFNHTSYYRLINLPEPGRNLALSLRIPFQRLLNQKK
ncbi:MAG: TonB-dependent receptor [Bacteroidales bacterium]|nr:TonB-dependent receptor [Bacteroidales bacterium]